MLLGKSTPSASEAPCVIVDLDGPILDGRLRHHQCYLEILHEYGLEPLPLDLYWRMKRQGICLRDQLAATNSDRIYESFKAKWLNRIEASNLLELDALQPGVVETLDGWQATGHVRLVLATMRQSEAGVMRQLERFGLASIWDAVLVCPPQSGAAGKCATVREALGASDRCACLWIGDTEVDVHAARGLGCPVWAVSCGVRNHAFLTSLLPDRLSTGISKVDVSAYTSTRERACRG